MGQKSNACEVSVQLRRREAQKGHEQGLKKKARNHRSDSKLNGSEVQADVSVKQPNKRLTDHMIKAKAMLAAMKMKQNSDATSDISTCITSSVVFRDVNKDQHGFHVRLFSLQLLEESYWQQSKHRITAIQIV